ncbi:MAG: hypothetical protein U0031_16125 [Thermomicrobiales bacterium]
MTFGSLDLTRRNSHRWRTAVVGLVLASLIVGVAISLGGTMARSLNPIGGLIWIASGVLLAMSLPPAQRPVPGVVVGAGAGFILGAFIRPATLEAAIISFGIAGLLTVLVAGDRSGAWGFLVPSVYLPVHLIIGIGRAVMNGAPMRTDPPPTAMILPLMMIVAAAVGAAIAAALVQRQASR